VNEISCSCGGMFIQAATPTHATAGDRPPSRVCSRCGTIMWDLRGQSFNITTGTATSGSR